MADVFYQNGLKTREENYKEINNRLEEEPRKLDTITSCWRVIPLSVRRRRSAKSTLLKIKSCRRRTELRRIEYQIKSEVTHREHMIALINTVIVPLGAPAAYRRSSLLAVPPQQPSGKENNQ